jgi:hypothetical protein
VTYDVQSPDAARLFPYLPDWRGGFSVSRSFKSDIITSRNNSEQRRAIRNAPRIGVEYRTVVQDADLRWANHFLRAWQNKPTAIPDFARWSRTDSSVSAGATAIVIDPLPAWVAEGQNLVLCGDEMEQVLVDSVAGTTVNLADALDNSWPSGSVVRPTFFGLMESTIRTSRRTPGAAEISVSLNCYPGGEPPRAAGSAWATLDGREVFTRVPDYAGPPSVSFAWPMDRIDYGHGRTAQFRPVAENATLVEADFSGLTVATAAEVEQFFDRHKGRRTAFWCPTWGKDFTLNATALAASSAFLATGSDWASDFGATDFSAIDVGVAVYLTDGTAIFRKIADIAASAGNSTVTVNAAWGVNLTVATVARICLMPLTRFASDEMTMRWVTPLSAESRLGFQQVRL